MYNILSIDGGGVRGLIPARILAHLEQRLAEETGREDLRIAEAFDFVAGTSIGGVLAMVYTLPPGPSGRIYSADEICQQYLKMLPSVFSAGLWKQINTVWGLGGTKYDPHRLETWLRFFFRNTLLSQLTKPCLVTAYDFHSQRPLYFRSHLARDDADSDFALFDIARATSAAPSYFTPYEMRNATGTESHLCSDGILFAYSPALTAYAEVRRLSRQHNAAHMYMLSLGTGDRPGHDNIADISEWGGLQWSTTIGQLMASCSALNVDEQLRRVFYDSPDNYVRITPELGKDCSTEMDKADPENLAALMEVAESHIEEKRDELEGVVETLLKGMQEEDKAEKAVGLSPAVGNVAVGSEWAMSINDYLAAAPPYETHIAFRRGRIAVEYEMLNDWLDHLKSGFVSRLGLKAGSRAVVAISDGLLLFIVGRALAEMGVVCSFHDGGPPTVAFGEEVSRGARVVFLDSLNDAFRIVKDYKNVAVVWTDANEFVGALGKEDMAGLSPVTSWLGRIGARLYRERDRPIGSISFGDLLGGQRHHPATKAKADDGLLQERGSNVVYSHRNLVAAAGQMKELVDLPDRSGHPLFVIALPPRSHSALVIGLLLAPRLGASIAIAPARHEALETLCKSHRDGIVCLFAESRWYESLLRAMARKTTRSAKSAKHSSLLDDIGLAVAFDAVGDEALAARWAAATDTPMRQGCLLSTTGPLVASLQMRAGEGTVLSPVRGTRFHQEEAVEEGASPRIFINGPQLAQWQWQQEMSAPSSDWVYFSDFGQLNEDGLVEQETTLF